MSPEDEWRTAVDRHRHRIWHRAKGAVLLCLISSPALLLIPRILHGLAPSHDHHCNPLRTTCWSPAEHLELGLLVGWFLVPCLLAGLVRGAQWASTRRRLFATSHAQSRPTTF